MKRTLTPSLLLPILALAMLPIASGCSRARRPEKSPASVLPAPVSSVATTGPSAATQSPSGEARTSASGTSSPAQPEKSQVPEATRAKLVNAYPYLKESEILKAKRTDGAWELRVRDPGGMSRLIAEAEEQFEEQGFAMNMKESRVNVIHSLGHGVIVMTRGSERFEMSADQDPTDKKVANVRLKSPSPVQEHRF